MDQARRKISGNASSNFPNREGSKPAEGQIAAVALMDARSIAATARNGGVLTAATDVDYTVTSRIYRYDNSIYEKRVYNGFGRPDSSEELRLGPNITGDAMFQSPLPAGRATVCI